MSIITEVLSRGWRFNGSSLIQYKTQFRRPITSMQLDVTFNSVDSNGILMFASRYANGTGPYILLQLKNGALEFGLSTGTHKTLLRYFCFSITVHHISVCPGFTRHFQLIFMYNQHSLLTSVLEYKYNADHYLRFSHFSCC